MNEPVNLPPDAPRDPLLDALRERLGDYGAPPPPGAWAGIRQRLPAPAPPWWRRPRRLLPLLALLLFVGLTGYLLNRSGRLGRKAGAPLAGQPAKVSAQRLTTKESASESILPSINQPSVEPITAIAQSANAAAPKAQPDTATFPATTTTSNSASPTAPANAPRPATTKAAPPVVAAADSRRAVRATRRAGQQLLTSKYLRNSTGNQQEAAGRAATGRLAGRPLATAAGATRQLRQQLPAAVRLARLRPTASGANQPEEATLPAAHLSAEASDNERTKASHRRTYAARQQPARPESFRSPESPIARRTQRPGGLATHPARPGQELLIPSEPLLTEEPTSLAASPAWQPAARAKATAPVSLAPRRAGLLLLAPAALPGSLAARPDSSSPARPVRRWALLATAGPTLSYRTIGAAPAALGTRPDFAHLERPALGFGAQVQVRRVLSGRWALAVGLGYQEYATRLALQVHDTLRVRQRDTYQLLTLPVQLSYALGTPRGRLAKALLLGAEVGWYRGGRSTEGSDCGCQQRAYTATTADSLYAAKSLALSLGLDLRYRLGGPASRWQWLVQPTARYVLTPFVQPAAGFSPRQPFSLGLLTGFSWDIR